MTTVGAVFLPQYPPERLRSVAVAADEAGLAQLWLWEDCFRESGIAAAAAALAWTGRLQVGVGLLPVPLRNVAITAMELATLHRLFPRRAIVGVGHGVQDWMGQVGARVESPLTLLREHLTALRSLLAGETVTTAGRYVQLDAVALDWPPPPAPPPVLAGAEGPRTVRLSGSHADGTILTGGTTPAEVARARTLIDEGRAAAGRTGAHPITVYVPTGPGPDGQSRVDAQAISGWGWESTVDRAAAGSVDEVAAAVARWADAGADAVVLQPPNEDEDAEAFVAFAADVGRAVG
jgi:alkanesulfonate monooxygenase SsuD/methylene tetrahydromethanopterin reductase-like flavin-dependent oxidoreductase (luciferase family)